MQKSKFKILRQRYQKFIYKNYSYKISNNNLEIFFDFILPPDIKFKPEIIIENIDKKRLAIIGESVLNNLIFHLGLIEIPSYWKATCSPEIEIKTGYLDKKQINWWKKLIVDGMGQFYYENRIDWRQKNFLQILNEARNSRDPSKMGIKIISFQKKLKGKYLVPFAGGRDSIVTLEELKKIETDISLFTVNPIEKIQKTVEVSGIKNQIVVRRIIDKKLLELNKRGFLNGHTPFTGVLSFISVICAVLFDYKNIAFSNEKSSNEGNVKYLGKIINHQWAKSSIFEKMFSDYAKKYLVKDINYFSYIRKYSELEISKILAKYHKYFPVFSSCNAGMKIGAKGTLSAKERWCGNCPKCLFIYLSLYPFLTEEDRLLIFGRDIFENKKLLPVMKNLLGKNNVKPFECVGTKQESRKAFNLCLERAKKSGKIPFLLTKIK